MHTVVGGSGGLLVAYHTISRMIASYCVDFLGFGYLLFEIPGLVDQEKRNHAADRDLGAVVQCCDVARISLLEESEFYV